MKRRTIPQDLFAPLTPRESPALGYYVDRSPEVRLAVSLVGQERDVIDARLYRRSPGSDPSDPAAWIPTAAGFTLPRAEWLALRAVVDGLLRAIAAEPTSRT